MKAELLKEHEDGGATFLIDLNPEELTTFICLGIVAGLKEAIDSAKQYVGETNES